ncbi:MAG: transcriptional regulator [Sphingobium sp.]
MTPYEALIACRDAAGSDSQMARDLGVTQPRVWRWINRLKEMPAEFVLKAEEVYSVSRHWLRPDIYPVDLPSAPSRWSGVDRRADARANGIDRRVNGVSFDSAAGMKGAVL